MYGRASDGYVEKANGGGEVESCLVNCWLNMLLSSCTARYRCSPVSDGCWRPAKKSEGSGFTSVALCSFFCCRLDVSSSAGCCSGEAELEAAFLSKSSNLFFSFLPGPGQHEFCSCWPHMLLTVVALSDPILYPSSLGQVGNLGPIFIWVRTGTEGAARA